MENNKLIAEFMGANPFRESETEYSYEMWGLLECLKEGDHEKHFYLPNEMKFNESWDWLMPVIEEIDHLQRERIQSIEDALSTRCIGDVYNAVVEFINQYNNE